MSSPQSVPLKILDFTLPKVYTSPKPRPHLTTVPPNSLMSAPQLIPSEEAVGYLVASGGNAKLAAVNATKDSTSAGGPPITEAQLLAAITNDPNSLAPLTQQLNLLLILNTVESLRLTHHAFIQSLPSLSAKDAANTYIRLLQTLTQIARPSESPSGQGGVTTLSPDEILSQLPSDVSDAIKLLMDSRGSNTSE